MREIFLSFISYEHQENKHTDSQLFTLSDQFMWRCHAKSPDEPNIVAPSEVHVLHVSSLSWILSFLMVGLVAVWELSSVIERMLYLLSLLKS